MVLVLAHRGATAVFRDNTVAAFNEARRLGADGVELDVRRSADHALVVHHDAEVAGAGPIAGLRMADLPEYVPRLDVVLDACGQLVINIELKDLPGEPGWDAGYPLAGMVAGLVAERDLAGRVVVSSFELAALDAVRRVNPAIATGWLTLSRFDPMAALESVVARGHTALHPHHLTVTPDLVAAAHRASVTIVTWTVDEPDQIRYVAEAGVDAIITNQPQLARQVLDQSG